MANENYLQILYQAGARWAVEHFDEIVKYRHNRAGLEELVRLVFADGPEPLESLPVRVYNFYRKNEELAESRFTDGVWDVINNDVQKRNS